MHAISFSFFTMNCNLYTASIMWFWPHMNTEMKMRFIRVLPCCFSLSEEDEASKIDVSHFQTNAPHNILRNVMAWHLICLSVY
jgi:hypothetical protein